MLTNKNINIRDPFVLVDRTEKTYYLYGTRGAECWGDTPATGLDVYTGNDLVNWSGPHIVFTPPKGFWADRNFWAPEVHAYRGAYYMFVTFKSASACRGTQILRADSPLGPFTLHSNGPVTPHNWECLDGTLFIDDNAKPWMIFCHEWIQVHDGEMCAVQLSDDLSRAAGSPTLLFKASAASWVKSVRDEGNFVTDGPSLYRAKNGHLLMLWSTFGPGGYTITAAHSASGRIEEPWTQDEPLFTRDGGHGMVFTDLAGNLILTIHQPNTSLAERPVFFPVADGDRLKLR